MRRDILRWTWCSVLVSAIALVLLSLSATFLPDSAQAAPRLPRSVPDGVVKGTKILSINKLLRRPLRYSSKQVLTAGFLVRHESRYLLFPNIKDYEEWNTIKTIGILGLPEEVALNWEKYERAYVHLAGEFQAPCGGTKPSEKIRLTARPLGSIWADSLSVCVDSDIGTPHLSKVSYTKFLSQHTVDIDKDHPHYWHDFEWRGLLWGQRGRVNRAANGFLDAVRRRDFDSLIGFFGLDAPFRLRRDLAESESVITQRLYDGKHSVNEVLKSQALLGLKIGTVKRKGKAKSDGDSPYALACLCKKTICLGDWKPTRYGMVAEVDPLLCLGMEKGRGGWHVDFYPFLTPGHGYDGIAW